MIREGIGRSLDRWRTRDLVYFLRSARTGLIKIGRTSHFRSRYSQLCYEHREQLEVLGVVSEDRWEERALHKLFKSIRAVNEWFKDKPALRAFIAEHATPDLAAADTPRNEILVPIDRHIAHQCKKVAAERNVPLHDYLNGILRSVVDDDYNKL